ncbi:MAG: disulfide bond formation protein DsbA [Alphaproteobacteria bacterium]|nr:disulfide bond formation protein DsbA [Alphaproteobacteria bacterium]
MKSPLVIDYYTDILCVWAWIAQRRNDELEDQWGNKIDLRPHWLDIFGDTATRIGKQWQDRGGYNGFGKHVLDSSSPYDNAPVSATIWQQARPATSATAHRVLKAVELAFSAQTALSFATTIRKSFFVDTQDIARLDILLSLAEQDGLSPDKLSAHLDNGTAMAALLRDYQTAREKGLKGSPSWVMNNGRQTLSGNVGYRILDANIREITEHPAYEASWC